MTPHGPFCPFIKAAGDLFDLYVGAYEAVQGRVQFFDRLRVCGTGGGSDRGQSQDCSAMRFHPKKSIPQTLRVVLTQERATLMCE